jgi:predicted permease
MTWSHDLKFALRSFMRTKGLTVTVVVTLALGIGANTAIFSVLEGIVLSPLPYRHPQRLVLMALYNRSLGYATDASYPDFLDWQRSARSFEQMAAYTPNGFDLTSPGTAGHLDGNEISSTFFSTLGVKPALGRDLSPEEDRQGGAPAAIISHRLWQDRFAASPAAIGKSITLSGVDYTIVGVLPPNFRFGDQQADVYTAIGRDDPLSHIDRTIHNILCIARLRPEVSLAQAQAETNILQERIDQLNLATERGLGTYLLPLKQFLVGDIDATLILLLGAVGLVLLIACANVANLLLARSVARTREFAVRLALGASRMQIVRQLITESMVLSLVGGALGLTVAEPGLKAMLSVLPRMPRTENISVNAQVLLFAFALSMTVGIVFGLLPAIRSSKTDLQASLKQGGRSSSAVHPGTQGVLVIVQIALAMVLLTGGSLLLRTIHNLWTVNPGFDTQRILTFQVGLSPSTGQTPAKTRIAYRQLTDRIRATPGIQAADVTALVPLSQHDNSGPFWIGSRQPASMAEIPRAVYYWTGPNYLDTMGIQLLHGRFLSDADNLQSEQVVAIDDLLARTYFPDSDAVGQIMTIPHWGTARIVGVVGHAKHWDLSGADPARDKPQIYASFYQLLDQWVPAFSKDLTITIRTSLDMPTILPAIKNAVHSDQSVYNVHTMQEFVSASMTSQRLSMILLATFAGLALLLASIGIYSVISYSTAQRIPELGIRMALGAGRQDVLQMVIWQGLRLALVGIAIGAVAASILSRAVSSFSHLLYGVRASDPLTFIAVSFALLSAALLACYPLARRAAHLDPMIALRHE